MGDGRPIDARAEAQRRWQRTMSRLVDIPSVERVTQHADLVIVFSRQQWSLVFQLDPYDARPKPVLIEVAGNVPMLELIEFMTALRAVWNIGTGALGGD